MSNIQPLQNSLPSPQDFSTMKEVCRHAINSGLLPTTINTPEKALIILMKGRELGIPPFQAFSSIAVVNGKPTMSAELMLAMIYRNVPGAVVDFVRTDDQTCVISAKRPKGKATKFEFSMDQAKKANLTGKGPWVTYPSAMLRARCISAMARAMFPDALSGVVYTAEELGAQVDDEGVIVEPVSTAARDVSAVPVAPMPDIQEMQAEPGDYKITFGQWNGKTLKSIPVEDLDKYATFLTEQAAKKNRKPEFGAKEFIDALESYIDWLDAGQIPHEANV